MEVAAAPPTALSSTRKPDERGRIEMPSLISPGSTSTSSRSGGANWRATLRPTRHYQPFSVQLLKTTHDVDTGTRTASDPRGIPRNFASRVKLERPSTGERREVDISMNQPLRYGGLTFFQHQMDREEMERGGRGISVLQVVKNPSWLAPYFGTLLVLVGLMAQFMIHLVEFLRRRTA